MGKKKINASVHRRCVGFYTINGGYRKFAELGFKRSAEKCKEKFEEESSYFNNINHNQNNYTKINGSYRVFSDDLEELYTEHDDHVDDDQHVVNVERNETVEEKPSEEEDKSPRQDNLNDNYKDQDDQTAEIKINPSGIDDDIKSRKRKREEEQKKKKIKEEEFEMFKGFCEEIVKNMMIQQEEMHNKLLEDMVKRDEEKVAREEIWKKKEIERINEELELRAQEQAISGDRQSAIINFLKNFVPAQILEEATTQDLAKVLRKNLSCYNNSLSSSSSLVNLPQNPNPPPSNPSNSDHHPNSQNNDDQRLLPKSSTVDISCPSQDETNSILPTQNHTLKIPTSSPLALTPQDPNSANPQKNSPIPTSVSMQKPPQNPQSSINEKEDIGKRWPRDEVLALINLRCSLYNNNNNNNHDQDHKEGSSSSSSSSSSASSAKAPLWERISQGMLELGYKRSAKRCKEKWENINKYFRKTRDVNKKRSIDSRTCPYFHQLSTLYNQGTLVVPSPSGGGSEDLPTLRQKNSDSPETLPPVTWQDDSNVHPILHVPQSEKSVVQIPSYDFDF